MKTIFADQKVAEGTGFVEWDITDILYQAIQDGEGTFSLKLESETNNYQVFTSRLGPVGRQPTILISNYPSVSPYNETLLDNQVNNCAGPCQATVYDVYVTKHDGNHGYNLLDCDLSTRWSAESINGSWEYAKLELEDPATLTGTEIAFHLGNQRTNTFFISLKDDNDDWVYWEQFTSSGTTLNPETFAFTSAALNVKYVYYFGNGNSSNNWNSLTELRAIDPANCRTVAGTAIEGNAHGFSAPPFLVEPVLPKLIVVPNPTSSTSRLIDLQPGEAWQLFDQSGKVVAKGEQESLDLEHLPAGLYILRTTNGRSSKVIRL